MRESFLGRREGGVRRQLIAAVLAAASGRGVARLRLVQSPAHLHSVAPSTKVGFDVQEPLVLLQGGLPTAAAGAARVRATSEDDVADCNALCRRVHGLEREDQPRGAVQQRIATVAVRGGQIVGYATGLGLLGHAVADTTDDLKALGAIVRELLGETILLAAAPKTEDNRIQRSARVDPLAAGALWRVEFLQDLPDHSPEIIRRPPDGWEGFGLASSP